MDIFVVDDEPIVASTTAAILKLSGYAAIAFTDPHDALAAVSPGSPRLVIADLKMPGLSGLALATRIREFCPGCSVILFTGLTYISDSLEDAQERGSVFSLLFKPVTPTELLLAVRKILG
jgi:DNA-binding NtrC family response regulator